MVVQGTLVPSASVNAERLSNIERMFYLNQTINNLEINKIRLIIDEIKIISYFIGKSVGKAGLLYERSKEVESTLSCVNQYIVGVSGNVIYLNCDRNCENLINEDKKVVLYRLEDLSNGNTHCFDTVIISGLTVKHLTILLKLFEMEFILNETIIEVHDIFTLSDSMNINFNVFSKLTDCSIYLEVSHNESIATIKKTVSSCDNLYIKLLYKSKFIFLNSSNLRNSDLGLIRKDEDLKYNMDYLLKRNEELEQIVLKKNTEILTRLFSEENTLNSYKEYLALHKKLEANYAMISKKYNLLSKSKLGMLTLKFWKFLKRIPSDF